MTTEIKQSEQIRQSVERKLDNIVFEIARELKQCFERSRNETINHGTPYFHLMVEMGLVNDYNPVEVDLVFGNNYKAKPKAREVYDNFLNSR